MLSLNEIKKVAGREEMTDEEASRLRDASYELAALALESFREKYQKEKIKS